MKSWDEISRQLSSDQCDLIEGLLDDYEEESKAGNRPSHDEVLLRCKDSGLHSILLAELKEIDRGLPDALSDSYKRFGRFVAVEMVNGGGQGNIYKGFDPETKRPVAIKVALNCYRLGNSLLGDVETEAKILQEVEHRNIVEFIDCGYERGDWFVVTEWVMGIPLSDAIKESNVPLRTALDITNEVASTLEYGEQIGLLHRDIKPSNIMIGATDPAVVTVLDYGLAKMDGVEDVETAGHVFKGTVQFAAPEIADKQQDHRSDIYSLGIVLLSMLKTSYKSDSHIPRFIKRICRKATAATPVDRYQSATEFKSDLETAIDGMNNGRLQENATVAEYSAAEVSRIASQPRVQRAVAMLIFFLIGAELAWYSTKRPVELATAKSEAAQTNPATASLSAAAPWSSFFNSQGRARIVLETEPPGAAVYAYHYSQSREPNPNHEIELGVAPVNAWMYHGYYLIVAVWPDGRFSEVTRVVPQKRVNGEPFVSIPGGLTRTERGIQLSPIRFVEPATDEMQLIDGVWIDNQAVSPSSKLHWRTVISNVESHGKRLPFLSELSTIAPTNPAEWTGTITHVEYRIHDSSGNLNQVGWPVIFSGEPHQHDSARTANFSYRGVRSASPFGGVPANSK